MKTGANIHTVRGNVVHSILEHFFDTNLSGLNNDNYQKAFQLELQRLLLKFWGDAKPKFDGLNIPEEELQFYFEETLLMLLNWLEKFNTRLTEHPSENFADSFKALTPIREKGYINQDLQVRGFIDAIEGKEGDIRLMDYKTSKRFKMSEEYKLQLGIYALLYKKAHGEIPKYVGIYFLKDTDKHEHILEVDDNLLKKAQYEIELIHMSTNSNNINDYPKRESPLCKWSTGQCDFYDICFKQKTLDQFEVRVDTKKLE